MIYRHGDLIFKPVSDIKGEKIAHDGSFVLALGEHTGHKHVLTVPSVDDMEIFRTPDGGIYMRLKAEGTVTHEEHRPVKMKPDTYSMGQEREFEYALGETVKVID